MKKKEPETLFDKCAELDERLSSYMRGIEGLRTKFYENIPANKTEKELIHLIDEHIKTALADMLILKDVLFEVEQCNYDYTELSYLLDLLNEKESIN